MRCARCGGAAGGLSPAPSDLRRCARGDPRPGDPRVVLPCATWRGLIRQSFGGLRELRQNLSVYLDRVKKGEALTVTEHGTAVAILRPLSSAQTVLERLVADGRATAPSRSIRELPRPLKVTLDKPLSEILDDLRDGRAVVGDRVRFLIRRLC